MESTMGEEMDFSLNKDNNKKSFFFPNEHFFNFFYVSCVQAISNNLSLDEQNDKQRHIHIRMKKCIIIS